MTTGFDADEYRDTCSLCGTDGVFVRRLRPIRETYNCSECQSSLRERSQARCLLDVFAPQSRDLKSAIQEPSFSSLKIYEPGASGPFRQYLNKLPGYQRSDYDPEGERSGPIQKSLHQDLHRLTFPDNSFDLAITSDILEHVRRPLVVFGEIHRVLRPGGSHVFTVPLQHPAMAKSRTRVDTSGPVDRLIEPERFHGDGKGGQSLVYTDFGLDIIDMLQTIGFAASLEFPSTPSKIANSIMTVVAQAR